MPGPPLPASAASQLDGPPPSPQLAGGGPQGEATPMSLQGLAPNDPMGVGMMPPEILSGVLAAADTVGKTLDSFAQVAPDLGMEFSMVKTALAQVLAKLVARGAQPPSPTAVGSAPPMGGMDRGLSGGGMV